MWRWGTGKVLFLMEEEGREDSERPLTLGWLLPVSPVPPRESGLSCHLRGNIP